MKKYINVRTFAAAVIGAALFFVLGHFVSVPTGVQNTTLAFQYGILSFTAGAFGPAAGCLAGLVGHFLINAAGGGGLDLSWIAASAFFGAAMGLFAERWKLGEGKLSLKSAALFNAAQAASNLISWVLIAPVLDILIYAKSENTVFIHGLAAGLFNILVCAVTGTVLYIIYCAVMKRRKV